MSYSFRRFWAGAWRACLFRPPVRPTFARVMAMFVVMPFVLALGLVHGFFLLLDDFLFPRYRDVAVRAPLFILGPPRSGTTFLHRTLARDTERFATLSLGEMIFLPSICERYLAAGVARLDRLLGRPLARGVRWCEQRVFGRYEHIHHVSMFAPEEDFLLLTYAWSSPLFLALFPYPEVQGAPWYADRDLPAHEQERLLRYYLRMLQRHLYFHGEQRMLLSKNPFFTSFGDGLRRTFPDAHFIFTSRDPYAVVPSFMGLWKSLYHDLGNDPAHYLARDFAIDWLRDMYLYAAELLDALPPAQGCDAPYAALTTTPQAEVLRYYARFGWEASAAFRAILAEEDAQVKQYSSRHSYSLAQWGLSEEAVFARMGAVFARYEFGSARREEVQVAGE